MQAYDTGLASAAKRQDPDSTGSGGGGHQKVKTRVLGNHTSTYRVLQGIHEQKTGPPIAAKRP